MKSLVTNGIHQQRDGVRSSAGQCQYCPLVCIRTLDVPLISSAVLRGMSIARKTPRVHETIQLERETLSC